MIETYGRIRYVWLFSFCSTVLLALLFQKFLLPLMPALHAGHGVMKGDADFYHQSAQMIADTIRAHGWSAWRPWSSATNTTGNVAVLAALYVLFGASPALIIPVNACLNATSAVLLLLIGRTVWPGRVGNLAGIGAALLFTLFPTSLSWYSQPLKDCYVFTGLLLALYSWLVVLQGRMARRALAGRLSLGLAGILLIDFVKPYHLKLLLVAYMISVLLALAAYLMRRERPTVRLLAYYAMAGLAIVVAIVLTKPYYSGYTSGELYSTWDGAMPGSGKVWRWQNTDWMPEALEHNFEVAANTRAGMIAFNQQVGAGSLIDKDASPQTVGEVLAYLPRALQIGLFAPFPGTWLDNPGATHIMADAETLVWYAIFPGLLLALYYRRALPIAMVLAFAVFYLTVFAFVTPNIGTLYRYRFVFEFLLMVVGLAGWFELYARYRKRWAPAEGAGEAATRGGHGKEAVLGGALMVSLITLVGYLGFFLRDLILVRWMGAGDDVDAFFLGSMIPMFFISVVAMPVGQTLVPRLFGVESAEGRAAARRLISAALTWLVLFMFAAALVLWLFAPFVYHALGWQFTPQKLADVNMVMQVYLAIMCIGVVIIVGNAILNAEGRIIFPSMAQLIVPLVVILVLLVTGTAYGIRAVVYAMLAGQVLNLVLVGHALWRAGLLGLFRLEPVSPRKHFPFHQYVAIAAGAVSAAMIIPVANSVAATMPSGSVSIIGMGVKVIVLITGVIGMGLTTALLPYFSRLVSKAHHSMAQSELSFFLLLATVFSVPISLVLRMMAAPMVSLLMANSALTEENTVELIRTVQYGMAQLPFYACGLIIIKYLTASERARPLFASAVVGLATMGVLGAYLSRSLGVSGVSLAITISVAVSAMVLLFYLDYRKHLPAKDTLLLAGNWLVAIALFVGLHFHMGVELVIFSLLFLGVAYVNWGALMSSARQSRAA